MRPGSEPLGSMLRQCLQEARSRPCGAALSDHPHEDNNYSLSGSPEAFPASWQAILLSRLSTLNEAALCFVSSWLSPGMEPPLLRALAPGGPPASTHNSAKPPTLALSAGGLLKWLFTRVLGLDLCLEKNTTLLLSCVYINVCQMSGCSLFVPTNSHPDLRAYCSLFFSICFIIYCS